MLKPYLQLLRIPGIFTAISNVVMGFLVSQTTTENQILLLPLMVSSGLLYSSGMVLNDYFDYNVDKTQRPTRPLPSGKIQRRSALILGIIFLSSANIIALFVSAQTILLTVAISGLILLYNMKVKNIITTGIFTLCLIRVLNVYLGFTAVGISLNLAFIPIPLAILIASLSILGKVETESTTSKITTLNLIMLGFAAISLLIISSQSEEYGYLIFFTMFIGLLLFSLFKFNQKTSTSTQNKITYQLLSIIFLDATIIAAFLSSFQAALIAALFIPAYLLVKKIYLT